MTYLSMKNEKSKKAGDQYDERGVVELKVGLLLVTEVHHSSRVTEGQSKESGG